MIGSLLDHICKRLIFYLRMAMGGFRMVYPCPNPISFIYIYSHFHQKIKKKLGKVRIRNSHTRACSTTFFF